MFVPVHRHNLALLRDAGVTIALGSDAFTETAIDEMVALGDLGVFSPAELLRIATMDTPRAIFPERAIGRFEEGAEASFLGFAENPLETLEAVREPAVRVRGGGRLD